MGTRTSRALVPIRSRLGLLTLDEVAGRSGLSPALIRRMVAVGAIDPAEGYEGFFEPGVIRRAQLIFRLRRDLGITIDAASLVADLLDRVERLETRLRWYDAHARR